MQAMAVVLKLKYQDQLRRVRLQQQDPKDVTYEDIRSAMQSAWPEVGSFAAKYLDDEGDLCTLNAASFPDFVQLATEVAGQKVLKLEFIDPARPVVDGAGQAASAGVAAPVASSAEDVLLSFMDEEDLRKHHGVTCDGCGANPLKGPRFRCAVCPDYDLCGECFAQKSRVHGEHEFTITWPPIFAAGTGHHGPRCQRPRTPTKAGDDTRYADPERKKVEMPTEDPQGGRATERLAFPVVVEDGRRLVIDWEHGEDPQQVAQSFLLQHGIPADEMPTIIDFVEHATAVTQGARREGDQHEPSVAPQGNNLQDSDHGLLVPEAGSMESLQMSETEEAVVQLQQMGFGEPDQLRALLETCGGDVRKVVDLLMQ